MTVFRCFLKMVKRNSRMVILYFSIFLTISVCMQLATGGKGMDGFEQESLDLAVIDRDGSVLARELTEYLGRHHHLVALSDDEDAICEALFYRNVVYVVIIPAGYGEGIEDKIQTIKIPGTNSAYYVDQQIGQFLGWVNVLETAGYDGQEIYERAAEADELKTEVGLMDKNGHGGVQAPYAFMFQYMPYIILSIICYVIGSIMIGFRDKEVRRRMECSAMPPRQQNSQLVLGYLVLGAGVWLVCILMPVFLYGKELLTDPDMPLYMANVLAVTLVSLAISFTVGTLVRKEVVLSAVVNVIALGMSFVCGVFVSMEVLNRGVRAAAQFLPFYWYESVNQILAMNTGFTRAQERGILEGLGIQGLFAAAILCVGLVLDRYMAEK